MSELFLKQYIIKGGKIVAFASFILGSLLLLLYINFKDVSVMFVISLLFIDITVVVNTIMGLLIIVCTIIYKEYRLDLFKTLGLILLNIPIGIGYFYLLIAILFPI